VTNEGARVTQKPFLTQFIAGWLIPGSGHILSNRKSTGWLLLVLVNSLWLAGMLLCDYEAASRLFHPWLFWAGAGCGTSVIVYYLDPAADLLLRGLASVQEYQDVPRWSDTGVLLVYVAGLLNILCLLDLLDSRIDPTRRTASHDQRREEA
jgi:hypothetical protein